MESRDKNGRTKEMFWRKVLARYAASNLSQADFCRQEGLNPNNLSWWKREIAKRDESARSGDGRRPKSPQESLETYWRKMVRKFDSSGLSKTEFCERERIKPAAFCWWRGELERRDMSKQVTVLHSPAPAQRAFLPLCAPESLEPGKNRAIAEIDMVTGTIRIFERPDPATLLILLKAFKEAID